MVPDAERIVSAWLRDQAEITALVEQRVYTALPEGPTFPLLRITRIGGAPISSQPLHLDAATIQFDAYGGPKKTALTIAETVRELLSTEDFRVAHEIDGDPVGTVTAVQWGILAYVPDDLYTPAQPRYVFDASIFVHT